MSTAESNVSSIYDTLTYFARFHESGWIDDNDIFKSSDSLVRVIYLVDSVMLRVKQIEREISNVSRVLRNLFQEHGILVRGGMAFGNVCANVKQNILFGPAMNRAVELESSVANWPRVMVDRIPDSWGDAEYYNRIALRLVKDGDLFYIAHLRKDNYKYHRYTSQVIESVPICIEEERFKRQRARIVCGLAEYRNSCRVLSKYQWIAREHNAGIRAYADDAVYTKLKELFIPENQTQGVELPQNK